jgi:hypothetical protein
MNAVAPVSVDPSPHRARHLTRILDTRPSAPVRTDASRPWAVFPFHSLASASAGPASTAADTAHAAANVSFVRMSA